MANLIQRYGVCNLTQGAADAFVQNTIETDIIPAQGLAWKITEIEVSFNAAGLTAFSAANAGWWLSVSRDTKTAIPEATDGELMAIFGQMFYQVGAAYSLGQDRVYRQRPEGLYVVEPFIYCQLDSTNMNQVLDVDVRVYYETVKVSEIDILRILNNA